MKPVEGAIAVERALTIYLDKREIVTLMTLGNHPELLILGWLRNQRMINDIEAIKAIQVDWEIDAVAITTYDGVDDLDAKARSQNSHHRLRPGHRIRRFDGRYRPDSVYHARHSNSRRFTACLKALNEYNEIYKNAGAVHGCALCSEAQGIEQFIEDVGRHNAVDAIAGHMWLNDLEGADKLFYTTGRLTSEMVIKVALMGIPVLLSRSGITAMGLEIAQKVGVTLIARAKGRHFLVYHGGELIEFDDMPPAKPAR